MRSWVLTGWLLFTNAAANKPIPSPVHFPTDVIKARDNKALIKQWQTRLIANFDTETQQISFSTKESSAERTFLRFL